MIEILQIADDREVFEISDDSPHFYMLVLTDYHRMPTFIHQPPNRLVHSQNQRTGSIVDGMTSLSELLLEALGGTVSGDHHIAGGDLVGRRIDHFHAICV